MIDKNNVLFHFDKSYSMSYNARFFSSIGDAVVLYDFQTGVLKHRFHDIRHPTFSHFIGDNMLIVKNAAGWYYLYDLSEKILIRKIKPPKGVLGSTTDFVTTPDAHFILDAVYRCPFYQLAIIDILTGEYTFYDLGGARNCQILCDNAKAPFFLAIAKSKRNDNAAVGPKDMFTELSSFANPFQMDDKRILFSDNIGFLQADCSGRKAAFIGCSKEIRIVDVLTGEKQRIPYQRSGVLCSLKLSGDGKRIAVAENTQIRVIEIESQKQTFEWDVDYGCFVDFCDKDTKLLVGTWEGGLCLKL